MVARVAGSPSRRRMRRRRGAAATVADPLTSQVDVVGQAIEERLVKVVDGGATTAHVSVGGRSGRPLRPGAPVRRRGPDGIAAVGRRTGHLR